MIFKQMFSEPPAFAFTVNGSGLTSTNVRTAALAAGWDGSAPVVCTLTGTFTYSGGSTPDAALVVAGSFPGGITVINKAVVRGKSGYGGRGGDAYNSPNASAAGLPGGTALFVSTPCVFDNQGSLLGGGGGGGGGGSWTDTGSGTPPNTYGGGGGGSGQGAGPYTGDTMIGAPGGTATYNGSKGGDGSVSSRGGGGAGGGSGLGGNGGNGGTWGQPGTSGVSKTYAGAAGGRAGYAVDGNSYITWINTGTRTGGIV